MAITVLEICVGNRLNKAFYLTYYHQSTVKLKKPTTSGFTLEDQDFLLDHSIPFL